MALASTKTSTQRRVFCVREAAAAGSEEGGTLLGSCMAGGAPFTHLQGRR